MTEIVYDWRGENDQRGESAAWRRAAESGVAGGGGESWRHGGSVKVSASSRKSSKRNGNGVMAAGEGIIGIVAQENAVGVMKASSAIMAAKIKRE
jgi:hypothetical protein